jgi:hypothetical protein
MRGVLKRKERKGKARKHETKDKTLLEMNPGSSESLTKITEATKTR